MKLNEPQQMNQTDFIIHQTIIWFQCTEGNIYKYKVTEDNNILIADIIKGIQKEGHTRGVTNFIQDNRKRTSV